MANLLNDLHSAWSRSQDTFWPQTWLFLSLTLRALGLALLAGIPAGLILTRLRRIAGPIIALLGLVQTIPSLVLLALLIPLLGTLGPIPALVAAVVYCLFPIVLNTYVGVTQVSPAVRDAARGMGMTDSQVLWDVELPLALPVLLAGVRTAAVYASGMIVIGALVGAGGLGEYVNNGMSRDDYGLIWLGALPVLAITLLLFWSLGSIAWLARKSSSLGMGVGGGLIAVLSLYAGYDLAQETLRRPSEIVIGAKDFTEGQILAELMKQTIESRTGVPVRLRSPLGTIVIFNAVRNDAIDLYAEYTGNLLTSKEALNMPVPSDRSSITPLVRAEMRRRFNLVLLKPFGLNNTYAPCVTQETARRYRLRKISDLAAVPQLRVVMDLSFMTRPDGWQGLVRKYDLHFDQPPRQVSPNLLYKSLEQNAADLVVGFATDWQIQALNLVVLEDDRGYFPSYHAAPLARSAFMQHHPDVAAALDQLAGRIDDETMRRLNYQVSVGRKSEAEVARTFLHELGVTH